MESWVFDVGIDAQILVVTAATHWGSVVEVV